LGWTVEKRISANNFFNIERIYSDLDPNPIYSTKLSITGELIGRNINI
jgi:hypothetical protein